MEEYYLCWHGLPPLPLGQLEKRWVSPEASSTQFFSLSTNSILEPVEASHFGHSDGATELLDVQGD